MKVDQPTSIPLWSGALAFAEKFIPSSIKIRRANNKLISESYTLESQKLSDGVGQALGQLRDSNPDFMTEKSKFTTFAD